MIPYSQKDNVLGHLCCAKRYKLKQMEMAKRIGVDVSTIRELKRRTIGLLSSTKDNQISPCLTMATRWRHKTTLWRRQDRLNIANLDMWRFQFHILLWSLIVPHLFFINKVFLQTCLPFNLDRMINIKPNFITVHSFDQILVKIQAFSMKNSLFSPFLGIFHTMVILIIVGSLFKIPPLRSGGTSAQKIKEI